MSSSSFAKRERDLAKKAKAEAKRQRRLSAEQASPSEEAAGRGDDDGPSGEELLQQIEDIHRRYDQGLISDEDFQLTKADLLSRLRID